MIIFNFKIGNVFHIELVNSCTSKLFTNVYQLNEELFCLVIIYTQYNIDPSNIKSTQAD